MPKLTQEFLIEIANTVNNVWYVEQRKKDRDKFYFYNGQTKDIIRKAIEKEFKKKETVDELLARLLPLNILKKITDKRAMVYLEPPVRSTVLGVESDEELMAVYEKGTRMNAKNKEANRYLKLFKRNLAEWYVSKNTGTPKARNLPKHTYEVFSFDTTDVDCPDTVVKIIKDSADPSQQILYVVTADEARRINGAGAILTDEDNPDGVNPYGRLPFVYLNEASYSVDPLQDDDAMGVAIAVPVILTDLLFACKYQCFSVLWTIGVAGDIPFNPSSVISTDYTQDGLKPEINTIKPEVDSDKVIKTVSAILSLHLSNNNLSTGTLNINLDTPQAVSGVSKILDSAETMEDRKDQYESFYCYEMETWGLLADIIPVWRKQGLLSEKYNKEFSTGFEMQIEFKEPAVMMSDDQKADLSIKRIKGGISTLNSELHFLYPNMNDDEIAEYEAEIELFKSQNNMGGSITQQDLVPQENAPNGVQSDV